jgi:transcriptional regulator with XRE-family HTH domain
MTRAKSNRPELSKALQAFGAQIRALRNKRGWSQEELAYRAGIHVTYLSGLECGRRNPTLNVVLQLGKALDIAPSGLFKGIDRGALRK